MGSPRETGVRRREFIATGLTAAGALALSPALLRAALAAPATAGEGPYGPLLPPDANALMLPPRFTSREVARGLQAVEGTGYSWPIFSDGQAAYRTLDGGWILVTNAESLASTGAGSSAIRFDAQGRIRSAYRILGGTNANCAGGPTPWGTWLSCEEHPGGMVWECDPAGVLPAAARPALGVFSHEAAAVDPVGERVYLTEDAGDAAFYRFTPEAYPDLSTGLLEVAVVGEGGAVEWREVPDPMAMDTVTRNQVPGATRFDGGEGAWYDGDVVYFTTKGDKKVWAYDARASRIEVLFDRDAAGDASLDAVDNVTVSAVGEIYVCEDGGNMEIGLITPERTVSPFLRFVGEDHSHSEVCGVVFDPSGTRMYCTSQGAYPVAPDPVRDEVPSPFGRGPGAVYEVSGPFRLPEGGVPPNWGFGPPAGELRPDGPLAPTAARRARGLAVRAARRIGRATLLRRGLGVRIVLDQPGSVTLALRTADLARTRGQGGSSDRPRRVTLARRVLPDAESGATTVRLRLGRRARQRLRARRAPLDATLSVLVRDAAGRTRVATRRVRIGSR